MILYALQTYEEEDDKMRTTTSNADVHVVVGGGDILSKWQLLAKKNKH
jgi:transcription initiation factor TFIID subunit 4